MGFPDGRRQGRAVAVHLLVARIRTLGVFCPPRFGGGGVLEPETDGPRGDSDPAAGLVRCSGAAGRDLRNPAGGGARESACRAAPELWPGYGAMALGAGACSRVP